MLPFHLSKIFDFWRLNNEPAKASPVNVFSAFEFAFSLAD